jgi:glutathione reductase (NADPH)
MTLLVYPMDDNKTFDLVVIGTGVAASTVAWKCQSAGLKIAVIDSRPFGGTCALRGCDPKKVLVGVAEIIDLSHRMESKGVGHAKEIRINWPELMYFKRSFTEPVPKRREEEFSKAGIAIFHGHARFTDSTTVKVGEQGKVLSAKYILVATGAKPAKLYIPGEAYITTSEQFLELNDLPRRIVFAGGGYISFEFAHIAARAGAETTIIHRSKKPLGQFDPDLVEQLVQRTRELGIDVRLQTELKGIDRTANGTLLVYTSSTSTDDNKEHTIEADIVVHGAGRLPDIEGLDLPVGGIEYEPKGVKVNDYLQSISNPAVYAAGDVVAAASGGPQLTPVATYNGEIVAANLLKGNHVKVDYSGVPSVVFTIPPLASVGIQEYAAKKKGLHFKTNHEKNTSSWYSSRRIGEKYSGFKVLIEDGGEKSGRILGAHLLGSHAEEVINIFAFAIRLGLTAENIKEALFSYPTNSSDIRYML